MFLRYELCGTCRFIVKRELVDHEQDVVLAYAVTPCPRHQPGVEPYNVAACTRPTGFFDTGLLQEQAVKFFVDNPKKFPRCEQCGSYWKKGVEHVCPERANTVWKGVASRRTDGEMKGKFADHMDSPE